MKDVFAHMRTFLPLLLELNLDTNYNGGSYLITE